MQSSSHRQMLHEVDPKEDLLAKLGSLEGVQVFHNQVLCAIYVRPERIKSGLYIPDSSRKEDEYQGKVGLIVQLGPDAFKDETGKWFQGMETPAVNEWIFFRASDGFAVKVGDVICRILEDTKVKGRVSHPDNVW